MTRIILMSVTPHATDTTLPENKMANRRMMRWLPTVCIALMWIICCDSVRAQSFGVELGNTLMPASGAMGGVSISQPQDLLSAINANPATLRQYRGTNFTFSGGWVEPTYNIQHNGGVLPRIGAFSGKSQTPGSALGNFGVTQDFSALGLPVTAGVGFISTAGAGLDVAGIPESNGTGSTIAVLHLMPSFGVSLTDRLSVGAAFGFGISGLDGIFSGISKNSVDYGVRGMFGINYRFNECQSIGAYYHTKEKFDYEDAIILQMSGGGLSLPQDIRMDLPSSVGVGIADRSLMNGRLLLGFDMVYRNYADTALLGALYDDQLAVQVGTQFDAGRVKLRMGYVWAENLLKDIPPGEAGGILPDGGVNALQYVQAQFATVAEHRISAGISIPNLLPGVDLDIYAGGMFKGSQQFGESFASIEGYWLGGGLTWRFGRGSGCNLAPNQWVSNNDCSCCP